MEKTKTLSEQLCELCGIKPRKVCGKCSHQGVEWPEEDLERLCCELDYFPEECKKSKNMYIDFENPENFVKLLELMTTQGMGYNIQLFDYPNDLRIDFTWDENENFYIGGNSFKEVYLRFCIQICNLENGNIKQAIRNYNGWV